MTKVTPPSTFIVGMVIAICVIPVCCHVVSLEITGVRRRVIVDYQDTFKFRGRDGQPKTFITYNSNRSVTFVVAPYCSDTEFGKFAKTSITSWLSQSENTKALIFENTKPSSDDMLNIMEMLNFSSRVVIGPKLDTDETNVPYIDDLFMKAFETSSTDMLCFINQDVILSKDFYSKVNSLYAYFSQINRQFAVIGKRCSIKLKDKETSLEKLHAEFVGESSLQDLPAYLNDEFSNDFILISKNRMEIDLDDIPAFYVGMQYWDTWLVGWLKEHIPVVVLGENCGSYHVFHRRDDRDMESKMWENFKLTQKLGEKFGIVSKMDWLLADGILYQKDTAVTLLLEM